MKWLLALYPRLWQQRFRTEVAIHLQHEPFKIRTVFDLLAGAIDAWRHPEWIPKDKLTTNGENLMITASRCHSTSISRKEAKESAFWILGICFMLTTVCVTLAKTIGPHIAIDALLNATLFIAVTIAARNTYLKPYSDRARNVLMISMILGFYGFFLGLSYLGTKI